MTGCFQMCTFEIAFFSKYRMTERGGVSPSLTNHDKRDSCVRGRETQLPLFRMEFVSRLHSCSCAAGWVWPPETRWDCRRRCFQSVTSHARKYPRNKPSTTSLCKCSHCSRLNETLRPAGMGNWHAYINSLSWGQPWETLWMTDMTLSVTLLKSPGQS